MWKDTPAAVLTTSLLHACSSCFWLVQELGADEVVDYKAQRIDQLFANTPFDAVVDPIGGTECT